MLHPRGIAIGCFKFAPRAICAGPPKAVDNVLSPFPHKITDARAWGPVIESEMTRGVDTDCAEAGNNTLGDLLQRHWAKMHGQKKGRDSERYRVARFSGSRSPGLRLLLCPGQG
ncbi:Hypothetical Protein RRSL_02207 [Ralstonia solanacearum UW551]|uniref:Integrase/recombinase remnant protein n=2 Tax=Ralstonia solanacearum TaxID=305 RepID=A0ABF7RBM8_RALSL|nr:Hypothetical Protein RRSL_02207 [Ralstonia solanacearum UW551]OYQ05594.1 hypothetical protein B7R79_05365 [Ralstonia solanacearum]PNQ41577.1 hypothetical protein CVT21_12150 [Ralstonia solanacearum]CEJ18892.1 putative integrase/recombinase remnant protein [Ralstonia solanacearum IPO1609]